ncbi:hypothetical protein IIA79_05025, partial [bacterium]|nr:hypothetical protein [bacterium]
MAGDPWKRAYRMSRSRRQAGRREAFDVPLPLRRFHWGWFIAVLFIFLCAGAAAALWFGRGWWVPRYRGQLPPALREVV